MRREWPSLSLDNGLLALAGVLGIGAALLVGLGHVQGEQREALVLLGGAALIGSGIAGTAGIARRAGSPSSLGLVEEERRERSEAEWLRRIAECAATVGDPVGTLEGVGRLAAGLLGFRGFRIAVFDRVLYGIPAAEDPSTDRIWRAAWEASTNAGHRGATYIRAQTAPPAVMAALTEADADAALLAPLHQGGVLVGMIVLFPVAGAATPSRASLELAGAVGRQASLVMENAFLYQQSNERADNLATIFRITQAVGSSLQSRVVVNRVLDVVQKILSADAVLLMRYDPQRKRIATPIARGIPSTEMLEATFRPGEDVPGNVFETREPQLLSDITAEKSELLVAATRHGLRSLLAVPLLARGRSMGVLVVMSREVGAFTNDELDLLATFASQAALAIDTAELFSREHDTVRTLQSSILPARLPKVAGIDSASIYLPAEGDLEIGGDYYDLHALPGGIAVLSIGDVCGKGVRAATKTSMMRHAARGMAVAGLGPAAAVTELNRMLLEQGDVAQNIVTLWLGHLDVETGQLVYANGGHPPALLLRPDRTIERLETTGALLGGITSATWGEAAVCLEPGSVILLYTDGVTEARRGTRFFGEGRVRRALRAGGSCAQIVERLLAHLERFTAGDIRDDAAMLAVQYVESTGICQDVTRAPQGGKWHA